MTESDLPTDAENTSNLKSLNNEAIQGLLSLLDLSDGFTIALAECNFWQDGVALVAALNEQIETDSEWEELQLVDWEFNEPELRLLQELMARLRDLQIEKGKKLVLVLRGLENAIAVVGDYPKFLVDLNFVRDGYIKNVPHPVVFVLPDYAITRFAQFAADFWAWRSGVFRFKTSQETKDFAEAKIFDSGRNYGSYLKPEKQERIDLLHRLLMEANPSGSDPNSNRNASSQMNILIELGSAYSSLSEFNRAIDFYRQALEISQKIGDRNGEAKSLNWLGNAYCSLSQYHQAILFHQQSLEIKREIGDRNGEASSLNNLGNAYNSLGQYKQAIHFYHQSLEIFKEIGDFNYEANSLDNLGSTYHSLGQYQQSMNFYQQSLEIFKKIGNLSGEAASLTGLGNLYHSQGHYQQSIQFYEQVLAIDRKIGDRNGEANSLMGLGNDYCLLGHYQQSIQFYEQALEIDREIGDRSGEAASLKNLGLVLKELGLKKESSEALSMSRKIFEELEFNHEVQTYG